MKKTVSAFLRLGISCLFFLFFFLLALHTAVKAQSRMESLNNPVVVLQTTEGNIQIELFPNVAPKAVENFLGLVKKGYYDGVIFHRVIKGFMIQTGDPTGTGRGGKSLWEGPFADEFTPENVFDKPGLVAMANRGPNTNGSQFFITTVPTPWLNHKHTIFGEVVDGFDVVKRIENVPVDANKRPKKEEKIIHAYVLDLF